MPGDEDEGAGAQVVSAVAVKIPEFWPERPVTWFAYAEAQFTLQKITVQATKYAYIISALPRDVIVHVLDEVEAPAGDDPYDRIKAALIERFTKSAAERIRAMDELFLGEDKPSVLLRKMQSLATKEDRATDRFRLDFINKMPEAIQQTLADKSDLTLSALASKADDLVAWQRARKPPSAPISAVTGATAAVNSEEEALACIAALQSRFPSIRGRGGHRGNRGRGRGYAGSYRGGQSNNTHYSAPTQQSPLTMVSGNPPICGYHQRFGDTAYRCAPGCSKNGHTGSQH